MKKFVNDGRTPDTTKTLLDHGNVYHLGYYTYKFTLYMRNNK